MIGRRHGPRWPHDVRGSGAVGRRRRGRQRCVAPAGSHAPEGLHRPRRGTERPSSGGLAALKSPNRLATDGRWSGGIPPIGRYDRCSMKLRKKGTRERPPSGDEVASGRRRKRGKKAPDDVWYHQVSPIFDEPISDDFLGLVAPPEGEQGPYEEPSVQVTVERNLPPIAPPEDLSPDADPYGAVDRPMADPERYAGAWAEGLGGAHEQPLEAPPTEFGTTPAAATWAEHGFVGGAARGQPRCAPMGDGTARRPGSAGATVRTRNSAVARARCRGANRCRGPRPNLPWRSRSGPAYPEAPPRTSAMAAGAFVPTRATVCRATGAAATVCL